MTAEEIDDLSERIDRIGQKMEETIDLDRLFALVGASATDAVGAPADDAAEAAGAGAAEADVNTEVQVCAEGGVRIAVAKDEAFNFIYAETITALEDAGAQIVYFSPLRDAALPEDICGLYLPGGYPELYGRQLSENSSMRSSILEAVQSGLPTIAECGGFLYLSAELEDAEGESHPMVGLLPGKGSNAGKLVRFGYGYISAEEDSLLLRKGEQVPVHEFHYWDTTADGSDMTLTKMSSGRQWNFGYAGETFYAGFPHLYIAGGGLAERFISACKKQQNMADSAQR
jgi:cobyrinic acid a,c-diamide synthase